MSELEARLAALAAAGQTITYGALARDLGWRIAELTQALEVLMDIDARAGAPLRAALCEGRLNGGLPAQGFYEKATALGLHWDDPVLFVQTQRRALLSPPQP